MGNLGSIGNSLKYNEWPYVMMLRNQAYRRPLYPERVEERGSHLHNIAEDRGAFPTPGKYDYAMEYMDTFALKLFGNMK